MIYSLDILSPQPSLCVFGEEKYRTKIGVIISLLVFLAGVAFGIYFLYLFFIRANIGLVYMKETHDYVDHFNLSDSLFMIYIDDRFDESVWEMNYWYLTAKEVTTKQNLEMVPCEKNVTIPKKYNNILLDGGISEYKCIKPGQNISIRYSKDNIKNSVIVRIRVCDIDKNPKCKSHQEILDILKGEKINFQVFLENNNIDHYNESNPIQPFFL